MSVEVSAMKIVKYETSIAYYDGFTVKRIQVTNGNGQKTEVKFYHMDDDKLEQPPTVIEDYRKPPSKGETFNADVEATF